MNKKKSYTKKKHNEGGNLNEFTESQAQNPRPELGADVEPISHINLRVHGGFSFRLQLEKLEIWPGGPRGDTLLQPFFFWSVPVSHVSRWRSSSYPDSSTSQARLLE